MKPPAADHSVHANVRAHPVARPPLGGAWQIVAAQGLRSKGLFRTHVHPVLQGNQYFKISNQEYASKDVPGRQCLCMSALRVELEMCWVLGRGWLPGAGKK